MGAGSLVALLLGGTSEAARTWTVIGVGALMVIYVSLGGMRATTWIQIVKAVLLLGGTVALTTLVLVRFHGDVDRLLRTAAERSGHGESFLAPGLAYGGDWVSRFDFISLGLALVLGTAGLPHILSRFYTVPTARAARRSVVWSIGLIGGFYLMTIVLGFGAAALVGPDTVRASNAAGNTAVPLLALDLGGGAQSTGGTLLFAVVAAFAFATILAVVAGSTLASSAPVCPRPVRVLAAPALQAGAARSAVARVAAVVGADPVGDHDPLAAHFAVAAPPTGRPRLAVLARPHAPRGGAADGLAAVVLVLLPRRWQPAPSARSTPVLSPLRPDAVPLGLALRHGTPRGPEKHARPGSAAAPGAGSPGGGRPPATRHRRPRTGRGRRGSAHANAVGASPPRRTDDRTPSCALQHLRPRGGTAHRCRSAISSSGRTAARPGPSADLASTAGR
ncbi:Cation/acetate symporter ActP [Streptomyces tendae]